MESAGTGPRLIVVCGLPGSGKTTLAKTLESRLRAVRFCPDDWMDALSHVPHSMITDLRAPFFIVDVRPLRSDSTRLPGLSGDVVSKSKHK
jgi:molybdopterin-guanine dinucleotide biosynthesis protein